MNDLLRSTTLRWAVGIALWSVLLALTMFAFIYWQTAAYLREELAETLRLEVRAAAADPAATALRVDTWTAMDPHARHYGGSSRRTASAARATSMRCRRVCRGMGTPTG